MCRTRLLTFALVVLIPGGLKAQTIPSDSPVAEFKTLEETRINEYAGALESYLRRWLVDEYPERAAKAWSRDYSSIDAFLASVEPNRQRWLEVLSPPDLAIGGPVQRRPHPPVADLDGEWLIVPLTGGLQAEGVLVVPASATGPVPLVIAQHGLGSWPEKLFGIEDAGGAYHAYGLELVKHGFAVLAPMNLRDIDRRNRITRLCRLAGTTLPGIELVRVQRLLDVVLEDPRIDSRRVGMWGLSLGGMATMFWLPAEPRIQAGVVSAWFNHRRNKMAVPDPRYACFLETSEDHAFFEGWLTEFTDHDVVSLICPRPLLVQTGRKDRIAWWPQVVEEFGIARTHYERLGIADRIEMDIQDGGHEAHLKSGVRFLRKWLMEQ